MSECRREKGPEVPRRVYYGAQTTIDTCSSPLFFLWNFGIYARNLESQVGIKDHQTGIGLEKINIFWDIWRKFRDMALKCPIPNETSISTLFLKQGFELGQMKDETLN
jgi:hypothetical protein